MRILLLIALACGFAVADIVNVSKPYIIDSALVPRVDMVDANDLALQNGINITIDSVNKMHDTVGRLKDTVHFYLDGQGTTGTGNFVKKTSPTIVAPTISSPNISSANVTGATLNGTVTNSGTISGGTINANTLQQGGVQAVTTSGTQTLTNKTISGADNTLSNIGNGSLSNSSITIGSTSVSLGGTAATVAGLSLTSPTLTGTVTLPGTSTWNSTGIGFGLSPNYPLHIKTGTDLNFRAEAVAAGTIEPTSLFMGPVNDALTTVSPVALNAYSIGLGTTKPLNYSTNFNQVRIGGAGVILNEAATSGGAFRLRYNGYYDGTNRSINATERTGVLEFSGDTLQYITSPSTGSVGGAYTPVTNLRFDATKDYLKLGSTYGTGYNSWSANYTKLLVGSSGALWANNSADASASVIMSYNTYFDGTDFRGVYNGNGARFDVGAGSFTWLTYAGTTAGAIMTETERMRLNTTGLGVKTAPDSTLTVSGSGRFSGNLKVGGKLETGGNEAFDYDEGTFTAGTQMSTGGSNVNITAKFIRVGKQVTLHLPAFVNNTGEGDILGSGIPAALRPTADVNHVIFLQYVDNATQMQKMTARLQIETDGDFTIYPFKTDVAGGAPYSDDFNQYEGCGSTNDCGLPVSVAVTYTLL